MVALTILSVPQMTQEIVDLNRRIIEAADLPLSEEPDNPASRRRGCWAVWQLTRFTLTRSSDAKNVWQSVQEILGGGVAGEVAKQLVDIARTSIESWLALAQKTRAVWQGVAAETGASPEGLDEIAAEEDRIHELHVAVEKMHTFLTSRSPIDLARLQKGRADMAQGRSKKPEEMHAIFQVPNK